MHVLGNMVDAVKPEGVVLDLQVIRPNPTVEVDGKVVCEIDGELLFRMADAATAAVDALIRAGELVEQAIDDHDVRGHCASGADLITTFAGKKRLPDERFALAARPCAAVPSARALPIATAPGSLSTPNSGRFVSRRFRRPAQPTVPVALSSVDQQGITADRYTRADRSTGERRDYGVQIELRALHAAM